LAKIADETERQNRRKNKKNSPRGQTVLRTGF